jgi:trigger factor
VSELQIERGSSGSYVAEFEIVPEFELGEYLGIELEQPEAVVGEEEVDGLLEEMRSGQATVSKVEEERGLRTGDVAMIDFEGVADGKPVPGGSAKDFPLTIGSETFLPGFEESLVGAVGERSGSSSSSFPMISRRRISPAWKRASRRRSRRSGRRYCPPWTTSLPRTWGTSRHLTI